MHFDRTFAGAELDSVKHTEAEIDPITEPSSIESNRDQRVILAVFRLPSGKLQGSRVHISGLSLSN